MPRAEGDFAEKRVLQHSTSHRNNLRRIHRKISLEEKSFMSSAQFDKRLFLNKQAKFQQPKGKQNANESSKYSARSNLPYITGEAARLNLSFNTVLGTQTARKDLLTTNRRKPLDSEYGKKQIAGEKHITPSLRTTNSRSDQLERKGSDSSAEKLLETPLERWRSYRKHVARSKQYMVDDLEDINCAGRVNPPLDVEVNDPITYAGSSRKDWERTDKAEMKLDPAVAHPEKKNIERNPDVLISRADSSTNTRRSDEDIGGRSEKILSKLADTMKDSCTKRDPSMKGSNETDTDNPGIPVSTVTRPISRKPSSVSPLPAFRVIRRGSICDVKTFTSGRVLDFLSKDNEVCEMKNKRYLGLETEELKYCRYLRFPSPSDQENTSECSGNIPEKYRPSKNIVIGHTKVSPLL